MIRKNENSVMGGAPYAAPAVTVVDVHNEGLLCASGTLGIKDWETDDESLELEEQGDKQKKGSLSTSLGCPMGFEPMTFRTTI